MKLNIITKLTITGLLAAPSLALAADHQHGIQAPKGDGEQAFDIVHTQITTQGNVANFHIAVVGETGSIVPKANGKLNGAGVYAYVWPTSIDPAEVGFESGAGILSLAATSHPDFDDTPLYDESGDNNLGNDGAEWHTHWVVLAPDESCGPGALGVVDIPADTNPKVPSTWPGLPILLDSPGWQPILSEQSIDVKVPFANINAVESATFDGVTAGLRVNQNLHSPLLCVVDVFDVASGDLSLPGKVNH